MLNTSASPSHTASTSTSGADAAPRMGRVAVLAVGDVIVLLLFAAIGRASHHEARSVGAIVTTAAPFVIAWFVCGTFLGAFGRGGRAGRAGSAAATRPRPLLTRTAISVVVAVPVAMVLRALVFGKDVEAAFVIVAFIFNAIFLLGWRGIASFLLWRA